MNLFDRWIDPQGRIAKLRLEARARPTGMDFRLEGFNQNGKRVLSSFLLIPATREPDRSAPVPQSDVELAAETQEALRFLAAPDAQAVQSWFKRSDGEEPLDVLAREALLGLANHRDRRPLAMDVPDALVGAIESSLQKGRVSVSRLRAALRDRLPYVRVEDGTSVVWRPEDPVFSARSPADRAALQRFVARTTSSSRIDLRDRAVLFFKASPARSRFAQDWSLAMNGLVGGAPSNDTIHEGMYRVIGAVGETQWARLCRGEVLTAARLGVTGFLRTFLLEDLNLEVKGAGSVPDLYQHPLEASEGVDVGNATLRVESMETPVETVWTEGQPEPKSSGPRGGFLQAAMPIPFFYRNGGFVTTVGCESFEQTWAKHRIRYGKRIDVRVVIGLPHGFYVEGDYLGTPLYERMVFGFADLPQEFRDEFWRRSNEQGLEIAKRMRGSVSGQGTGPVSTAPATIPPH